MDPDKLRRHTLITYFKLRLGIGIIALLFPLVLGIGGWLLHASDLLSSMSAYYHTPLRDVFVGVLFAIGTFLYLYKGYSDGENYALNAAGVLAYGIALLPTSAPEGVKCETFTQSTLHGISAGLFFLAIAYVCIKKSGDTLEEIEDENARAWYKRIYHTLGILMVALPLAAAAFLHLWKVPTVVYWVEFFAIWIFAAYWIIKSIEIRKSSFDEHILDAAYKARLREAK